MNPIERAAKDLLTFLGENCAPSDAYDQGLEKEWPIALVCQTDEAADALAGLLSNLRQKLGDAGMM